MDNIRQILSDKQANLGKLQNSTNEVEDLINEIKIAELKWTEFEEQEDMQKQLLKEIWPKIPLIKDMFEEYKLKYEVSTADLEPLKSLLKKMVDHDDYQEDQAFITQMLNTVEDLIDNQREVDYAVDPDITFIEELTGENNRFTMEVELKDLEEKVYTANEVVKTLRDNIERLDTISDVARKNRENLKDAFVARNFNIKNDEYGQFMVRFSNLKEKMDMILERVGKEKEDPALDDYHKDILEEVQATLGENQPMLEELEKKTETDKEIIKSFLERTNERDLDTTL